MLAEFIESNRPGILARTRARVGSRTHQPADAVLSDGIPVFLRQVCTALRSPPAAESDNVDAIREDAARYGHELLRLGLTVGQVVQCYGDVCQVVTELAVEHGESIGAEEFRLLNLCLDDAIATAVGAYAREREFVVERQATESVGVLAHELRNVLNTGLMAYEVVCSGQVSITGSTGKVLGRSLLALRDLVDRTVAEVRLDAGSDHLEPIVVADFLGEVELGAQLNADARSVRFAVTPVHREVSVEADRQMLATAITNLLQNAFKFTKKGSLVTLRTTTTAERVVFGVEDECGGLPLGKASDLFHAFEQRGGDRTGLGLGLSICRKAAMASAGKLEVRDLPGKGCVFSLDLPRIRLSAAPVVA